MSKPPDKFINPPHTPEARQGKVQHHMLSLSDETLRELERRFGDEGQERKVDKILRLEMELKHAVAQLHLKDDAVLAKLDFIIKQGDKIMADTTKAREAVTLLLKEVGEIGVDMTAIRDRLAVLEAGDPAVQAEIDSITADVTAAAKRLDKSQTIPDLPSDN